MTSTYQVSELKELEDRINQLIKHHQVLKQENLMLKKHQQQLILENDQLLEKTALAKTRIEAMIERLKEMEQGI